MNKAIVIGNITRDPDVRMTGSGISVCTFTVAVQRRFANQNGERQADFIPVVCWRGLAENCGKYLKKGSKVGVCGSIQTEIIADEVEFLDRVGAGSGEPRQNAAPSPSPFGGDSGFGDALEDDELPF